MCLRNPATVIFSAILILGITIALSLNLTMNTLKEIEADTFNIYMTFPNGNTLSRTDESDILIIQPDWPFFRNPGL